MTLKTQMTSDLSIFFNTDEFAESVTYTPKGGAGSTISAIVERNDPFQEPYIRGEKTATALIQVKKADVASPQYGDTFTFDSQTWEFDPMRGVIYEDDQVLNIGLERTLG